MGAIRMNGIIGFRRIFAFLCAQICVLGLFSGLALAMAVNQYAGATEIPAAAMIALLVAQAAILVMLRLAWPVAIEPVELLWGTSAKVRAERWMEPALLWGAVASAAGLVLLVIAGFRAPLAYLGWLAALGGTLLPGVASALMLFSARRRLVGYRREAKALDAQLAAMDGDGVGTERIRASINTQTGHFSTTVRPNPQGFTFAGITSKPWHNPADFPWVADFEAAVDAITEEATNVLKLHSGKVENYFYAGLDGDFWKSFKLATRHEPVEDNLRLCPVTARLLQSIPGYPSFRDAMFSILEPGGIIRPHRDVSNVFLTMHLPLMVPGNGFMEVGGLTREWRRGEAMIFDSSYHHQAQNRSDGMRVVLLVDFLHPDLTTAEQHFVRTARL